MNDVTFQGSLKRCIMSICVYNAAFIGTCLHSALHQLIPHFNPTLLQWLLSVSCIHTFDQYHGIFLDYHRLFILYYCTYCTFIAIETLVVAAIYQYRTRKWREKSKHRGMQELLKFCFWQSLEKYSWIVESLLATNPYFFHFPPVLFVRNYCWM